MYALLDFYSTVCIHPGTTLLNTPYSTYSQEPYVPYSLPTEQKVAWRHGGKPSDTPAVPIHVVRSPYMALGPRAPNNTTQL